MKFLTVFSLFQSVVIPLILAAEAIPGDHDTYGKLVKQGGYKCGPSNGNAHCPDGMCCGKNGQCGSGDKYCKFETCVNGFGRCEGAHDKMQDRCGLAYGNQICAKAGECCSPFSWCGTGAKFCTNAQTAFNNASPAPASPAPALSPPSTPPPTPSTAPASSSTSPPTPSPTAPNPDTAPQAQSASAPPESDPQALVPPPVSPAAPEPPAQPAAAPVTPPATSFDMSNVTLFTSTWYGNKWNEFNDDVTKRESRQPYVPEISADGTLASFDETRHICECPKGSFVTQMRVGQGRLEQNIDVVTALAMTCSDGTTRQVNDARAGYAIDPPKETGYFPSVKIQTGNFIDAIEGIGGTGGQQHIVGGESGKSCAITGFQYYYKDGFPQTISFMFACKPV